jgi:hypothetical protein
MRESPSRRGRGVVCLIGNGNPGFTHWGHQGDAFVEDGLVVAEVGLGEAQADVGVQVGQVGGEFTANLHVQACPQAFIDDADGPLESLGFLLNILGANGATSRGHSFEKAVEQELDQLMGGGRVDAGFDGHFAVHAGHGALSCRDGAVERAGRCKHLEALLNVGDVSVIGRRRKVLMRFKR